MGSANGDADPYAVAGVGSIRRKPPCIWEVQPYGSQDDRV